MHRRSGISALVLAAVVSALFSILAGPASAQSPQAITMVVARDQATPLSAFASLMQRVQRELSQREYQRMVPTVSALPPEPDAAALDQIRDKGQAFMRDLASGVSPAQMLNTYQVSIDRALELASAVTSEERGLLWSMCLLRVQLFAMLPDKETSAVENAVRACRLRFPDQHYFDKIWIAEVAAAFRAHEQQAENSTTLEVRSAPAACDVLVYGAPVGRAPLRVQVVRGMQEVQVRCGKQRSLLHHIEVNKPAALVVRVSGDAALVPSSGDVLELVYSDAHQQSEAVEHARAFAQEARAPSVVLIENVGADFRLTLHGPTGAHSEGVSGEASEGEIDRALKRLFEVAGPVADGAPAEPRAFKRTPDDYGVGFVIMSTGIAGTVPVMIVAAHEHDLHGATLWAPLGVGLACVAIGTAIIWAAPFGKRRSYQAGVALNRLIFGGTF